MRTLVPKIGVIRLLVSQINPDLLILTETWIGDTIGNNQIAIHNYNILRRDLIEDSHGGTCFYMINNVKFNRLNDLEDDNLEILWGQARPFDLHRGHHFLVDATVYHPPSANNNQMLQYLTKWAIEVEGRYSGCGIIVKGDFDKLETKYFCRQFGFKQLVNVPSRTANTLDLVLSHLRRFYNPNSIETYPPFRLSDHSTIVIHPHERS